MDAAHHRPSDGDGLAAEFLAVRHDGAERLRVVRAALSWMDQRLRPVLGPLPYANGSGERPHPDAGFAGVAAVLPSVPASLRLAAARSESIAAGGFGGQ